MASPHLGHQKSAHPQEAPSDMGLSMNMNMVNSPKYPFPLLPNRSPANISMVGSILYYVVLII